MRTFIYLTPEQESTILAIDSLQRAGFLIWEMETVATSKKTSSTKPTASKSNVTRIRATDDTPTTAKKSATKSADKKPAPAASPVKTDKPHAVEKKTKNRSKPSVKGLARPFVALGTYFAGAWYELKQVRWPTRGATWSLTGAVIAYSIAFTILIVLLDLGFKQLFELAVGN